MKHILFTLTVLFSATQVFACPNLNGNYKCTTFDPEYGITLENQDLSIIQNANSFTIDNDLVLVADGKFHRGAFGIRHKSTCDQEKDILSVEFKSMFVKAYLEYVPTDNGLIIYRTTKEHNKYISSDCAKVYYTQQF